MNMALIRTVLWTDLFRTSRRARRSEFWWGLLCLVLFFFFLTTPLAFLASVLLDATGTGEGFLQLLLVVALFCGVAWNAVASVTLSVRRLHDLNRSGWWYVALVAASAVIGAFVDGPRDAPHPGGGFGALLFLLGMIVIGLWPSSQADNRWGPAFGNPAKDASWRASP